MKKTEDDFKTNGASIRDMVPVFEHHGIQVSIFNSFINPIFKYSPTKYNHHVPTLYALVRNNHILHSKRPSADVMVDGGNPPKSRYIS